MATKPSKQSRYQGNSPPSPGSVFLSLRCSECGSVGSCAGLLISRLLVRFQRGAPTLPGSEVARSRFWSRFSPNPSLRTDFGKPFSLALDQIVADRAEASTPVVYSVLGVTA